MNFARSINAIRAFISMYMFSPDSDPSKRGEPTEDALRFFISEAEEFLFLLIVLLSKSEFDTQAYA